MGLGGDVYQTTDMDLDNLYEDLMAEVTWQEVIRQISDHRRANEKSNSCQPAQDS